MISNIYQCLIISLICSLGNEDYSTRDKAEKALTNIGWSARGCLKEGMKSPDPEIRHRCTSIYESARGKILQSFEPIPEIDSAWFVVNETEDYGQYIPGHSDEFTERYNRMIPYLEMVGMDEYPYKNYYTATRLWLEAEVDKDTDIGELKELLEEMRWRDGVFLKRYAPMPGR